MRIALLAPLWKELPPKKYGGSELVVANLARGLTKLGHRVTTFACGESKVDGELVCAIDRPMYDLANGFEWKDIKHYEFLSFFELGKRIHEFDIVHNHMRFHPIALAPFIEIPFVTTLHSSLPPEHEELMEAFREYPFVSISNAQRNLAPNLNYVATVHNGIAVNDFVPRIHNVEISDESGGFLFIGTLSWNKGIDLAVRTAISLKAHLTIIGEVREEDRLFFENQVGPYIDGEQIKFLGEVDHETKKILLRNARALLFPTRWNEAFGLVMVEALASGTPVVALNNGAVKEVIRHMETGLIADNEGDFIKMAAEARKISRKLCRDDAAQRFDLMNMAKGYERVYKDLINQR